MDYTKIKELYFPIYGFDNYEVSNFGNVRNKHTKKQIFGGVNGPAGYKFVNIIDNNGKPVIDIYIVLSHWHSYRIHIIKNVLIILMEI